ncbi:hypothetical protein NDU88_005854 [Pleurodeles waltl]|uniref:Uncharacterized protein n=1 Tax=Pleurodeles waltl TaxID=8319 RepID=A0AAV7TCT0_PLEWA|nr:hypothetical protein NDU88_005854 [Pleurodeles waltl]
MPTRTDMRLISNKHYAVRINRENIIQWNEKGTERRARWRPRNAAAKRLLRPRKPPSVAAALPRVGASFDSRA